MKVEVTQQQLRRLRRASDITEMQMLMARYVELMSKMDAASIFDQLFAVDSPEVSIELAEAGGYDGPEHVRAFLQAYDAYLASPGDKRGWMELQHLCNPTVLVKEDRSRAIGYWTILAPSAQWAMPFPCNQEQLTAYWGCGRYLVEFLPTDKGWKILKLKLVWYLRSPFELGWMKQPDCVHMPALTGVTPDRAPDYYNVFSPDYGCASGGIEWGPYLPDEY